jgi:rhodanese-related sulfurtransferase
VRSSALCLLALLAAAPLAADAPPLSPGTVLPTATIVPTPLSTPAVTPDARFAVPGYGKWPHISLEEAQRLHKRSDVLFVDGRAMVEWEQSHIPGAVALPIGEFDKNYDKYKRKIKHAKILVSYCHGEGCRLSDMLAQKLVDKGHHNVAVFWGGFPAWDGAQLPLVDKKGKTIPRPTPVPAATADPASLIAH